MSIFTIEMLGAEEGDALWIEYGDSDDPWRMLIDGGVLGTFESLAERIEALPKSRRFELMVVTHVDNDHIDALVKLLASETDFEVDDFWFNAWDQLTEDRLGPKQGEMLTGLIENRGYDHNRMAEGRAIALPADSDETLVCHKLPGGMEVTVLGPRVEDLHRLRPEWQRVIENAGLEPGGEFTGAKLLEEAPRYQRDRLGNRPPNIERWANREFKEDSSKANGSSISLLLEYEGKSALLTGDARSDSLIEGIDRLLQQRGLDTLKIDAFKVPHHGSKHNVSNDLMRRLECKHFLVSSSGRRFHHPDDDAIARILFNSNQPKLHFNYHSEDNEDWGREPWQDELGYDTAFPDKEKPGLLFDLNP